jgi:hypothetical protein
MSRNAARFWRDPAKPEAKNAERAPSTEQNRAEKNGKTRKAHPDGQGFGWEVPAAISNRPRAG